MAKPSEILEEVYQEATKDLDVAAIEDGSVAERLCLIC